MKKWKKKKVILIAALLAAVVIAGAFVTRKVLSFKKRGSFSLNQSYEVTTGSVDSTVSSTGSISMDNTTDIVASTGVIVKEVLVESGDEVKKGDILARLDKTSVVIELIEAKETKEDLEDQLDDDDLSDLEVEKIEGEIEEIEDRISALNKLHKNPVIKATVSGVVASVNVSVGSEITNTGSGSGSSSDSTDNTTSTSSVFQTSAKSGTASAVKAGSGSTGEDTGSYKASVLTLADPLSIIEYDSSDSSGSRAAAVTEKSQTLTAARMSTEGDGDGNQDDSGSGDSGSGDSGNKSESNSGDSGDSDSGSGNSDSGSGSSGSESGDSGSGSSGKTDSSSGESGGGKSDDNSSGSGKNNGDDSKKDNGSSNNPQDDGTKTITDISSVQVTAPVAGSRPQTSINGSSAYSGSISWSPNDAVFKAGTAYTATVTLTAKDGYVFKGSYSGASVENGGKQLKLVHTYGQTSGGSGKDQAGASTENGQQTGQFKKGSMSSVGGGGAGFSSASSSGSSSDNTTTEFYGTYKAAAFTISTRKDIKIVVSIDELDILSIKKGQTARVTLDALEDEEIEGTISKISTTATTSNGNAKYDVEITIPDNENIMDGMSASVVIVTDSAENTLIIPVLALQEKGDKKFVYTSQDKDGNLSGEVEVETGLSDGTNVQVTSGLSEGDTIYYTLASGDDFQNMQNGGFPGGSGGPGGGFPGGSGGPPSGGPSGGPGGGSGGGGK